MTDQVPDIVVGRLPIYLRTLGHLRATGSQITSSKELAKILGTSAAQIRKDLSHFGEFGKQGTGYHVSHLIRQLERILKVDSVWDVVLVGVGDIGHALLRSQGVARRGFHIVMAFDIDPLKVGSRVGEVIVQSCDQMADQIRQYGVQVAIVAVPPPAAQGVTDALVSAGVRAILNYSPIALAVPDQVMVQYTDPVTHLQHMVYYL